MSETNGSLRRAGLMAAMFGGLAATLAACPGPAPTTATGGGGTGSVSSTATSSTAVTSTSTSATTSSTDATSTSSGGMPCSSDDSCPITSDQCETATCVAGMCQYTFAPSETSCSDQGGRVCDGMGSCVECVSPTDCVDPTTPPPTCAGTIYSAPPVCVPSTHTCMKVDPVDCAVSHKICTPLGCDSCTMDTDCVGAVLGSCTRNACVGGACAVVNKLQGGDCGSGGTCDAGGVCQQRKYVFVTSATFPPTFGTASHADTHCHDAAMGLGGTWKAWVSDATSSPAQWSPSNVTSIPYFLLDDMTPVAKSWTALTTMPLDHAIDKDEHGTTVNTVMDPGLVWTGTLPSGMPTGMNCGNWSLATAQGTATGGTISATNSTWSALGTPQPCNISAHLYCFQQ